MRTASGRTTVEQLLLRVRVGLDRLTPEEAWDACGRDGVLVDVRSADEQRRQGVLLPGALHHPLSVLAWRLDPDLPTSTEKLPLEAHVILFCREGYSSSLAAAWLRAIGFERATDLIGGVDGWRSCRPPGRSARRVGALGFPLRRSLRLRWRGDQRRGGA